jgi:hypothetical protein
MNYQNWTIDQGNFIDVLHTQNTAKSLKPSNMKKKNPN